MKIRNILLVLAIISIAVHATPTPTPPVENPEPPFNDRNNQEKTGAIKADTGGIWYNPHNNGEGFFIHVDDRFPPQMTVTWYTYDDQGQQMWLIGSAEYRTGDNQASIALHRPQGTRFGTLFNSAEVNQPRWGTITFTFNSCVDGVAEFVSIQPDIFGSGTIPMTKLADNAQTRCASLALPVEPPFYSKDQTTPPPQGLGEGEITSIGNHQVNGIRITSERLVVINNRCHLEITIKNETGNNSATAGLAYQFISAGQQIASLGTGAVFTEKNETLIITNEITLFDQQNTGKRSCDIYDTVVISDFQAASL